MIRIVKYKSKTAYYRSQEQMFLGRTEHELDILQWQFEDFICGQHRIKTIDTHYDVKTIYEKLD